MLQIDDGARFFYTIDISTAANAGFSWRWSGEQVDRYVT